MTETGFLCGPCSLGVHDDCHRRDGDFCECTSSDACGANLRVFTAAPSLPGADDMSERGYAVFRKRPIEVEAIQYDGPAWLPERNGRPPDSADDFAVVSRFCGHRFGTAHVGSVTHGGPNQYAPAIRTLEGVMVISPGDWVIRGVKGEVYPCKPDVFDATYEPASPMFKDAS